MVDGVREGEEAADPLFGDIITRMERNYYFDCLSHPKEMIFIVIVTGLVLGGIYWHSCCDSDI